MIGYFTVNFIVLNVKMLSLLLRSFKLYSPSLCSILQLRGIINHFNNLRRRKCAVCHEICLNNQLRGVCCAFWCFLVLFILHQVDTIVYQLRGVCCAFWCFLTTSSPNMLTLKSTNSGGGSQTTVIPVFL